MNRIDSSSAIKSQELDVLEQDVEEMKQSSPG